MNVVVTELNSAKTPGRQDAKETHELSGSTSFDFLASWRLGVLALIFVCSASGCVPGDRLVFPEKPLAVTGDRRGYDTDGDGKIDFAVGRGEGEEGDRLDVLAYDDDEDGYADRKFLLSGYTNEEVPHLIVLLDSIPFGKMHEAWARGDRFSCFGEPVKVIAPFPSLSALCFTAILHAPPMPGPINRFYDPRPQTNGVNNLITRRLAGYRNPWQQRLAYNLNYRDNGLAFLNPRPWMKVEFEQARRAFDDSPDRVTIVYISSTAAMLAKYGEEGFEESMDELERFLLQVFYERRGAVKISVMADHGHNLLDTTWLDIKQTLREEGFHVTDHLKKPGDVFVEMDGLLTYFGVHTARPAAVCDALLDSLPQVETVSMMDGYDVIIRNYDGTARIREVGPGRLAYHVETANVLGYDESLCDVPLTQDEWFARTADAGFPDGPSRLWHAFHGGTVSAPQVMCTLRDGYCAGIGWFNWFVHMASTHGGLNQLDSATFLMTMTGRTDDLAGHGAGSGALRSNEVMSVIEPGYSPRVLGE